MSVNFGLVHGTMRNLKCLMNRIVILLLPYSLKRFHALNFVNEWRVDVFVILNKEIVIEWFIFLTFLAIGLPIISRNLMLHHIRYQVPDFADDLAIVTRSKEELIKMVKKLLVTAETMGFMMN